MENNNVIFTSQGINKLMLKNRVIMTAMHLGYSYEKEKDFYIQRAKGGVAAITTVIGVTPEGTYNNMLFADKSNEGKIRSLADAMHQEDCKLIAQLFCAGRNGSKGIMLESNAEPVAPSAVPSKIYKYTPKEMSLKDIERTIGAFAAAALLCKNNHVDCVEISCSAGYLLSQFLSPITNLRVDDYGGDKIKRMAFPIRVMDAVRKAVGSDYPVILRISGNDMIGGYDVAYMQEFISRIPKGLIDAINVTGGWHESPLPQIDVHLPKGGWAVLAGEIKKVTDLPVIACNRINDEITIKKVLESGLADFVGCARAHLADAQFVNKIKLGQPYVKCIGCNKGCIEPILKMKEVQCVMNPIVSSYFKYVPNGNKKILVIGAGVSGLTAAKYLAEAGVDVTVCTDESKPGGLVNLACIPPGKGDVHGIIDDLIYTLESLKVKIRYNKLVDENYLSKNKYDGIIVATGSVPFKINLQCKSVYMANEVLTADSFLLSKLRKGRIVIIGGGLVGIETALHIVEKSYVSEDILQIINSYNHQEEYGFFYSYPDVTILEMSKTIGKELGSTRFLTKKELAEKHVKIITNAMVTDYNDGKLYYNVEDSQEFVGADAVIMAVGYKSRGENLISYLSQNNIPYIVLGDAEKPANIKEAVLSVERKLNTI